MAPISTCLAVTLEGAPEPDGAVVADDLAAVVVVVVLAELPEHPAAAATMARIGTYHQVEERGDLSL